MLLLRFTFTKSASMRKVTSVEVESSILEVVVERDAYYTGELVEGAVVLRVTKPIQCQGKSIPRCLVFVDGSWECSKVLTRTERFNVVELALTVVGTEHLKWYEGTEGCAIHDERSNKFIFDKVMDGPKHKGYDTATNFRNICVRLFSWHKMLTTRESIPSASAIDSTSRSQHPSSSSAAPRK
jgi:hypothetical protein